MDRPCKKLDPKAKKHVLLNLKRSGGMSSKSSQKQARTLCWTLFGLALFPSLPPLASASDAGSVVGIYGDDEAGKTLRELFNKVSRFSLSI